METPLLSCKDDDQYRKDGQCCSRCKAGSYMKAECNGTEETECAECLPGFYTATKNHMRKCNLCTVCNSKNKQETLKECTPKKDTVCTCETGFYCSNNQCTHCQPVSHCPPGEGVKAKAIHTNDTICAPCEDGTYSNTTNFLSACRAHTRCEDFGRELKTPGTPETDAICDNFKANCHWVIPASLWSGLVLTALILFGLLYWRGKRRSRRTDRSIVPVTMIDMVPVARASTLELPLPSKEVNGYCEGSCTINSYDLPLYQDHDMVNDNKQDSLDSCLPITPLKPSVSFVESSHGNGSTGYGTGNFLRSYSEPQEDEWCGQ